MLSTTGDTMQEVKIEDLNERTSQMNEILTRIKSYCSEHPEEIGTIITHPNGMEEGSEVLIPDLKNSAFRHETRNMYGHEDDNTNDMGMVIQVTCLSLKSALKIMEQADNIPTLKRFWMSVATGRLTVNKVKNHLVWYVKIRMCLV